MKTRKGKVKSRAMSFFFKFCMQMCLNFTRNSDSVLQTNEEKNKSCNLGISGEAISLKFDVEVRLPYMGRFNS